MKTFLALFNPNNDIKLLLILLGFIIGSNFVSETKEQEQRQSEGETPPWSNI